MFVEYAENGLDGGMLYTILDRHNLLSSQMKDPTVCLIASQSMAIGFIHDGGDSPLAILLESYPEPSVIGLMFITEKARLNQRRDELIGISEQLRKRWFDDMGASRIESRIPVDRTQTIRCLRHMGFKEETLPKGLRNAITYNSKPTSLAIMSLLPSDPIKCLSNQVNEPRLEKENVT